MTNPYEDLAQAIILQAVKDYRAARKKTKYHQKNKEAKLMIQDCESFFRSDLFSALTIIDGRTLLEKLKEESICEWRHT